jgi:hypothetical protein
VLKRSNGCQGGDVFFLGAMSEAERRQLNARVAGWGRPECGVLQRHVSASFVQAGGEVQSLMFQVELRPFAFVIGDSQCLVGDHASGRAFRNADGRRLGNMSHGACYLSVIREPTAFAAASWEHGR